LQPETVVDVEQPVQPSICRGEGSGRVVEWNDLGTADRNDAIVLGDHGGSRSKNVANPVRPRAVWERNDETNVGVHGLHRRPIGRARRSTDVLDDAVAIGQVTPGPVFTSATFVGWQIDGPAGAAVATLGIFAPSFIFVALLGRVVPWMRARPAAKAFLTGLTTASLGLMAGVLVQLIDIAITDALTVSVALVSLVVLIRTRVNSAWLVAAGVVIGALHAIGV
jgi:hypothetical protein